MVAPRVKQRPYPAYDAPVVHPRSGIATDTWQNFFTRLVEFVANLTLRGTRADQPAANTVYPGTLYYVTDEGVMEQSTGSAWVTYSTVFTSVVTAALGALDGNGTSGDPLAVNVDGDTIVINVSNELTVVPKSSSSLLPANPTGTASLVGVMMGLAGIITPNVTGVVLLVLTGNLTNASATAGDGARARLRHGTGTAPANGDALTGTADGAAVDAVLPTAAALPIPFSLTARLTGLLVGTPYWLDISLAALVAGTAEASNLALVAVEVD